MDKLKPPHELKIAGGNLADRWERFLERFRWYLAAVGEDGSEDKKKVAILLTVAGAEAQEVFRTFTYEPAKAASHKQKLKKELDRLVQTEVLVKAERPTDWVLPLVIVEKPNGDLRLCLDPMDLNEYIRREHYHLPDRSEILSEMAVARYLTKMDASQRFYRIQLDKESTQLCRVATPFGRYSFKRLPCGINCAPEIFHAKIQQLFESKTGVKVFIDDIVVWGRTREEHDARLKRALATIRRSGLKLNEKKCVT
ncbi:hypothetical protein NP493_881g00004 [Ridgeia piscesae]|uniref:Reverse transcriptase domain-containing protein n=1 Tax=Ridgeia piscesae TaxID=27915 RepID=A0AAD9NK74_RIDPI|nr:hypothetical protein NP493_881g00004 [Ridgeia piscesae]